MAVGDCCRYSYWTVTRGVCFVIVKRGFLVKNEICASPTNIHFFIVTYPCGGEGDGIVGEIDHNVLGRSVTWLWSRESKRGYPDA